MTSHSNRRYKLFDSKSNSGMSHFKDVNASDLINHIEHSRKNSGSMTKQAIIDLSSMNSQIQILKEKASKK